MPRRAPAALSALAVLLFAAPAVAQAPPTTIPAEPGAGLTTACGGRAIAPDRVIAGEFGTNVNKDYVVLPFDVPSGTRRFASSTAGAGLRAAPCGARSTWAVRAAAKRL